MVQALSMKKQTLSTINQLVAKGEKFTCLTAYDYTFSKLFSSCGVETLLVGDSLGMTVQGHNSTIPVTVADIAYHTRAVAQGNSTALIIADMPFMSFQTVEEALKNAGTLMQAGAEMVKLEGGAWLADTVTALGRNGVPCCIHMGLTPQSVNKFGGYKVQGRTLDAAEALVADAIALEKAGADFLLLECVPVAVAKKVTEAVSVPVIGIGAGPDTDGQVLVCYDMLGLNLDHNPRFVKNFMIDAPDMATAVQNYVAEVKSGAFPTEAHGYLS